MENRELLELAAKANGFQVKGWIGENLSFFDPILESAEYKWNPLTDDGDALRLAVKLGIRIAPEANDGNFAVASATRDYVGNLGVEEHGSDRYAATRRAIVCVAAQIGRQYHEASLE